jgi:DNA-binding response OmpR family regulator
MRLTSQPAAAAARTVIAIDDSRTVLASLRHAFERLGLQVVTAEDASEISSEDFGRASLIVVDVQMEQMYGDDVVLLLRQNWQVQAPIYLYSSLPQGDLERRAAASGADGAVCKDQGVEALVARVKHLVVAA